MSRASLPLTNSISRAHHAPPPQVSKPARSGPGLITSRPASPTRQMGSTHCPGRRRGTLHAAGTELDPSVQ